MCRLQWKLLWISCVIDKSWATHKSPGIKPDWQLINSFLWFTCSSLLYSKFGNVQADIYLLNVNNGKTWKQYVESVQSCHWRHWCSFSSFIANFEQISHIVVVFSLLNLNDRRPAGVLAFLTKDHFEVKWLLQISAFIPQI